MQAHKPAEKVSGLVCKDTKSDDDISCLLGQQKIISFLDSIGIQESDRRDYLGNVLAIVHHGFDLYFEQLKKGK